ncbi:MAG: hypothetical protein ACOX8S_02055 [Christensenellales bacterium]|jgi:hypothetical protein
MTSGITEQLAESRYDYISLQDKAFIAKFDAEMEAQGYSAGGIITPGYAGAPAWGRHLLIYAKTGIKSKQVAARIYCTDKGVILRLFLSNVDRHAGFIEKTPEYIRAAFDIGPGDCHHCKDRPGGLCRFRKTYTLNGKLHEKCSGEVFQFLKPETEKLPSYIALFREFYPLRRKK